MLPSAFQWLVALRYLRMQRPRSLRIHWVTVALVVVLGLVIGLSYFLDHTHIGFLQDFRVQYAPAIRIAKLGTGVGFVLIEAFILLVRRLTIFTTISTYGLFLGSGALVIVLSVMSGFEADLRHKILGQNAHVVVTRPDQPFTDYDKLREQIARLDGVVAVAPYITNEVMIASSSNLEGVVLKGIDPKLSPLVTDLGKQIDVGGLDLLADPEKLKQLQPDILHEEDDPFPGQAVDEKTGKLIKEPKKDGEEHFKPAPKDAVKLERRTLPGVIIGRELAKNLRLYPSDDVNIVSPLGGIGPSGPIPKSKPFRVAGVFFSGMFEYDSKYIYITIPAAQRFLGMEDEVTGIELRVKDPDHPEKVVDALRTLLGQKGYEVEDWKELNRNLFSALRLEKIAMFIVLCFIILVAAFSIIANGIMLVMEKGREIAILKAMGARDRAILVVFVILGLYMGGLGTVAGIAVGIVACVALGRWGLSLDPDVYYITQLPVRMNPFEIGLVFTAALLIAILATLYPAWVAARLKPVEGLREGTR